MSRPNGGERKPRPPGPPPARGARPGGGARPSRTAPGPAAAGPLGGARRPAQDRIALQPPERQPEVERVEAAAVAQRRGGGGGGLPVGGVGEGVERAAGAAQ